MLLAYFFLLGALKSTSKQHQHGQLFLAEQANDALDWSLSPNSTETTPLSATQLFIQNTRTSGSAIHLLRLGSSEQTSIVNKETFILAVEPGATMAHNTFSGHSFVVRASITGDKW